MKMLDQLREKRDAISSIARNEREGARVEGVSSFSSNTDGTAIVEDKADGSREVHPVSDMPKPGQDAAE